MTIDHVVDGETELDSALFNPWVDHMNGLQTGAIPIALAGIEGALDSIAIRNAGMGIANVLDHGGGWGVADNIPAINAALSYVSDTYGGGEVVIPSHKVFPIRPSVTNYIQMPDNCRLNLGDARLTIPDDSPAYTNVITAIGGPTSAVSNVSVIGGEIDQNPSGHLAGSARTNGQSAIRFYWVDGMLVDGMTIISGAVNTIVANGPACRNLRVTNCDLTFVQALSTEVDYDNSAVYLNGIGLRVHDNNFYSTPADHARGCFELHGPFASGHGNHAWHYETIVNLVPAGATIEGLVDRHVVSVAGNIAYGAKRAIKIWPITGTVYAGISISGNVIYIDQLTSDYLNWSGIGFATNVDGSITGAVDGLQIIDNQVHFEPGDTRTTNGAGTALSYATAEAIGCGPNSAVSNAVISGNLVVNNPLIGIRLGVGAVGVGSQVNVTVERNMMVNSGNNRSWHRDQRSVFFLGGAFTNTVIRDNTTIVTDADGTFADQRHVYTGGSISSGGGNVWENNAAHVNGGHTLAETIDAAVFSVRHPAAATTLGTVTGKKEVFDQYGASVGFMPIYDAIT